MIKRTYIIFICTLIISTIFVNEYIEDNSNKSFIELNKLGNKISKKISDEIINSVNSVKMNEVLLRSYNFDTSKFESWAPLILEQFKNISSIQLAPNGIVKHIYPLQGNEKAIGHNLFADDKRRIAVEESIREKKISFIGPIKLIQNNKYALIVRKPIFKLDNGTETFWGFSTEITSIDKILEHIKYEIDEKIYSYSIYGSNPDSQKAPLFLSSKILPKEESLKFEIQVPNGIWKLNLAYTKKENEPVVLYMLAFIISCFITFLIHMYFKNIENEKNKFIQIIDKSSDNIHIISKNGYIKESSETFAKTLGYEKNEIIGQHISKWETIEGLNDFYNIKNLDKPLKFYSKYKKADGNLLDVLVTLSTIKLDDEVFINSSIKDVSDSFELKRIKRLQNEQSKLLSTLEEIEKLSKIGYWNYDFKNKELVCSKEFRKIYGLNNDTNISLHTFLSKCHIDDYEMVKNSFENSYKKEGEYFLNYRLNFDGNIKYVEIIWRTINENGKTIKTEGSIQDTTEKVIAKQKSEDQRVLMLHHQRLAQQGEMLEIIGHQWKQPLSLLSLNNQLMQFLLKDVENIPEEVSEKIENNIEICKFLGQTINDFKNFFSEEKISVEFTMEKLIDESLMILSHRIKLKSINVQKNFSSVASKNIKGLKTELGQVILAICNNAMDILEEKEMPRNLSIIIEESSNKNMLIKIIDNAGGIPKNVLPHVFEAYFSTKKDKNGTGLGLHMTKMIVEESFKGSIQAYNVEDGACFEISIPL